jgi:hypothetical protein
MTLFSRSRTQGYRESNNLKDISSQNIDAILNLAKKPYGTRKKCLRKGLIIRQIYDNIFLENADQVRQETPNLQTILELGHSIRFQGFTFSFEESSGTPARKRPDMIFVDLDRIEKLLIRFRQPGDRIHISESSRKNYKICSQMRKFLETIEKGSQLLSIQTTTRSSGFRE